MPPSFVSRFPLLLLFLLLQIPSAGGYDLSVYEPAPVAERRPGLQIALYKYYSPLYSIPNLDARRPDLITWLPRLNQPDGVGTWPEVNALNATPPQGFERYDGRTYGECLMSLESVASASSRLVSQHISSTFPRFVRNAVFFFFFS